MWMKCHGQRCRAVRHTHIYIYIRILTYLQHMTNITQATQRLLKHHATSYDLIPSASLSVPKARGSHGRSSRRHPPVVAAGPVASCGEKRDVNGECLPADRNLGAALMERWIRRQKSGLSKLKLSWTILFFFWTRTGQKWDDLKDLQWSSALWQSAGDFLRDSSWIQVQNSWIDSIKSLLACWVSRYHTVTTVSQNQSEWFEVSLLV